MPQGGVQEQLKRSTTHRWELNCNGKLSPQPTHEYTDIYTPNLPTVEKQPCLIYFPVTKIFSSITNKRNSQVLSRHRSRNAFFLFAHQVKTIACGAKLRAAEQRQQNLAHVGALARYRDSLELKALSTSEGETPLQKYRSHKISFNIELHGAFRTKEMCICLPYKTWPSVLTQVLSKLLLSGSLTSESPIILLSSRSLLLKMQSADQQQHPGSLLPIQNQATPQSHL